MISKSAPANPIFELMSARLADATVELFAAYDITVRRSTAMTAPLSSECSGAATIGYVGEKVRGALTILALESTIAAWMDAIGAVEGELSDALGEFSNMLLGRLKGCLLIDGFPILLATPTTASGRGLRLSLPPGQSTWLVFDGPGWQVSVRLDASIELGFALQDAQCRERPAVAGDAVLF
jgi:hypothetical protein